MPMCDIHLPQGVLAAETEQALVRRVSELLVDHELRRIRELMHDDGEVAASRERAAMISWMFVHRPEVYVAHEPAGAPHYKLDVRIPEGVVDDTFRESIARDILAALTDAESADGHDRDGWPPVALRAWVFVYEVPDGAWGAAGRFVHLAQIIDFVAPGWGENAEERWAGVRRQEARALVALAGEREASA